jgi:hypothetical protein
MKIYQIVSDCFETGECSFPTKAEAMREFRLIDDDPATLNEITITKNLSGRALLCALANGRGYAAEQKELAAK